MGTNLNAIAAGLRQEAVDNSVGVLRFGEDTLVVLYHQRHAVTLEPTVGVVVVEHIEQALHQPVATGIDLLQVTNLAKGVGAVAAPPTRHLNLGQHTLAALEDSHLHLGHHLLEIDG